MKRNNIFAVWVMMVTIPFSCQSQNKKAMEGQVTIDRQPAVAGSFYPGTETGLREDVEKYFAKVSHQLENKNIMALVSPHAGFVFSGKTAAYSYAQLAPDKQYENIFLIGSSHRVYFDGASIYNRGDYITPLGKVRVNTQLANKLIEENPFITFRPDAHINEHSLEVQLPFLQYRLPYDFQIVPVIIASQDVKTVKSIAAALEPYFNANNLFIISSDFSHFPDYESAKKADMHTANGLLSNSPEKFLKSLSDNEKQSYQGLSTSACGWTALLALLEITSKRGDMEWVHLNYENSGDFMHKDKSRVVGYHSFAVVKKNGMVKGENRAVNEAENFSIDDESCKRLLSVARNTLDSYLKNGKTPQVDNALLTDGMKTNHGVFVTLYDNGKLRGCIGRFTSDAPLYSAVQQMAVSAATEDNRFSRVTGDELKNLDIEISVLSPLKKIKSIDEIELGKHGIYIIKGANRGTFLPHVAVETGWGKEEFLGHCARDKARIGWHGWKDADIYTYEAFVISEKSMVK